MEIDVLRGCTQRFQNHDCTMTFLTNAGAIVPVINSCLLHLQGSRGPSQVRHSHFPKETGHGAGAYLTIGRHACADESVTWQDMDAAAAYLQEILGFVCGELLKTDFQYGTWPPALETCDNHIYTSTKPIIITTPQRCGLSVGRPQEHFNILRQRQTYTGS